MAKSKMDTGFSKRKTSNTPNSAAFDGVNQIVRQSSATESAMNQAAKHTQPSDEYFMRKMASAKNNSENKKFDSLPPSGQRPNQTQDRSRHNHVMTSA